jgi:hypothetical protein
LIKLGACIGFGVEGGVAEGVVAIVFLVLD